MWKIPPKQPVYLAERDYAVVKANELIQKSKFSLTMVQQKIILYLISKVRPEDADFSMMEFDVAEFCRVCGIDSRHHKNIKMIKEYIDSLDTVSWWMPTEDGMLTKMRWIEKAKIDPGNHMIYIRLDKDLRPYLLRLQEHYTRYELVFALHFKSKYSVRLYELVKSIHFDESTPYIKDFTIEELHERLGVDTYDKFGNVIGTQLNTWQHLRDRAFVPAVDEINDSSDKCIEWKPVKQGRSIVGVSLKISTKPGDELLQIRTRIDEEMGISSDRLLENW